MKKALKLALRNVTFALALGLMVLLGVQEAAAAEQAITPGSSKSNAPALGCNQQYFSTKASAEEYFKFTTPAGNGYYRIVCTNISSSDTIRARIETAAGIVVGSQYNFYGTNSSSTWILDLDSSTTYYVKVWDGTVGKNYGIYMEYYPDKEGAQKTDGPVIKLNTEYTYSQEVNSDVDYAVFTANATTTYRVFLTNIGGGNIYATLHAYASDRQIGNKMTTYGANDARYIDCNLEAGVKYYVKIWSSSHSDLPVKYSVMVSNQKAQQIKLNKTYVAIKDTYTSYNLTHQVLPATTANKDVTWSSSNTDVATVNSSGSVYARRVGRAVITCAANDGSGVKAKCVVVVKPYKMGSLYANMDKITSKSVQLKWTKITGASGYTIYQYKSKKWKAIASTSKSSYTVKKLKSGTTYKYRIAAYVKNGSKKVYGPKSATVITSTEPAKSKITSIKNKGSYSYYYRKLYFGSKKVNGATGYQYAYSRTKKGSYTTFYLPNYKRSGTITFGFHKGWNFWYKVRAYRNVNGITYYGDWSSPKKFKPRW